MKDFAPQSYYDQIIASAVAMGFRFLAQVTITTDDMPYHVTVDSARATCLTFDIPFKAVFVHFNHYEHTGFLGDNGYHNHWGIRVEYEYKKYAERLAAFARENESLDEHKFQALEDSLCSFELDNLQSGWSSGHDEQLTFTGDIIGHGQNILRPVDLVESILTQLYQRPMELLAPKFKSLAMLWPPSYVFRGDQRLGTQANELLGRQLDNLYWTRFGENRKIIRKKVERTY